MTELHGRENEKAVATTKGSQLPLPTLIETIKANIAKGDQAAEKAEQFYIAAGIHLREAKKRKPNGITWPAFLKKHHLIGRRRADELIMIADGRTTLKKTRTEKAASVNKSSQKKKSALASAHSSNGDRAVGGEQVSAAVREALRSSLAIFDIDTSAMTESEIDEGHKFLQASTSFQPATRQAGRAAWNAFYARHRKPTEAEASPNDDGGDLAVVAGESISAVKEQPAPGKQGLMIPVRGVRSGKKLEPAGKVILELAQRIDVILAGDTTWERVDDVIPVAAELHPRDRAMLVGALRGVAKRAARLADKLEGTEPAEARSRNNGGGNDIDVEESAAARKIAHAGDDGATTE